MENQGDKEVRVDIEQAKLLISEYTKEQLALIEAAILNGEYGEAGNIFQSLRKEVQRRIEAIGFTEVVAPEDFNTRRDELIKAAADGARFLVKKRGKPVAVLGPAADAPPGAERRSSRALSRRGELFTAIKNGRSFILKRLIMEVSLIPPPKQD